ncbi:monovalent cation:proton antiporter-2 (CPA2) family protein [Caulobacter vibrioides]|uniref:TrkA family protein n=2 Tax=Caulobacter vibrioides TaxID=155892 RepID=Q9ABM3_CAUVC|nr:monovalent cation:proton antiporter-2 (CPA2) family protein [Caulobacter vibrioides]YP_002515579.1 glutathione-regulated potassium-efflux system protein kefB [Caulobacter vibrioides NA1000]AAK22191.1 TrkA family protein [Caulobacter vibrioides CB15]ACL93671.1 glutathione-regulated potassium-efflux system protein kefB [Caulobacter vibrioides NA1000]ATC27036.1 potassium transporter [Caulobacter vibrioides]QXZ52298.1 monovalent cation:proton antiporter-2 (CPA2) family protein [Caulobacter vibr
MENILTQTLVYLGAAVVSVPIAKRLGLGSVLGYLIAGVLIGPFALSLVGDQADVMKFAEFGVVILLFLIGLEVQPSTLWDMRKAIFGLGGAQVVGTALAIAAVALGLGLPWQTALAVGLVLAMSSTAIVLQTLDEKGLRQGPVGRAAFGVLLLQDLAVIPLFALLPLLAISAPQHAAEAGGHGGSLVATLPVWAQTLSVFAAVAAVVGGGRYLVRPLFRFIAKARLREIFTASALLIVVAVASLMQTVGLSPALGAFLAGVVLAESEFRRELETDIEPFRGLLLGLFFMTVGAGVDLPLVARQPLTLVGLVLGLMVLKFLVMYGIARLFGAQKRGALAVATALAQGGEFAFVLLTFTVGAGVIGAQLAALLTAAIAVSMALTPVAMILYERVAALMDAAIPDVTPDTGDFDEGEPDIIIAGFGRFGQVTGRLLAANGFKSTVLDTDIEQIELLRRFGRRVHYGDATRLDLLRQAGADRARMLIVALDDREKTVELVETARKAFPNLTILARAWDRRHAYDLLSNGADAVERETFESALTLGATALQKLGFRAHRAHRAAAFFRRHDRRVFEELRPMWGQEEAYILASRDAAKTMDRLLDADLHRMRPGDVGGAWDTASLDEELRERAQQEGAN